MAHGSPLGTDVPCVLSITVRRGVGLAAMDTRRSSDPYVALKVAQRTWGLTSVKVPRDLLMTGGGMNNEWTCSLIVLGPIEGLKRLTPYLSFFACGLMSQQYLVMLRVA